MNQTLTNMCIYDCNYTLYVVTPLPNSLHIVSFSPVAPKIRSNMPVVSPPPPFGKLTVFKPKEYFREVTKYMLSIPDDDNSDNSIVQEAAECNTETIVDTGKSSADDNDDHTNSVDDGEWLNPITFDGFFLKKFTDKIKKLAAISEIRKSLFKAGSFFYTYSKDIAPLTLKPHNVKKSRDKTYGTVIKKSEIFSDLFLIQVYTPIKGHFYVTEDVIKFISHTSPSHYFAKSSKNALILQKMHVRTEEQDVIMRSILNAKIHQTPGHSDLTLNDLVSVFKKSYDWLSVSKLQYCLKKARKELPPTYASVVASKCSINKANKVSNIGKYI